MNKREFLIIGDLYAGTAFGFDIPSPKHISIDERNLLLVALARASKEIKGYKEWFDSFYDLFLTFEKNIDKVKTLKNEYYRLFETPSAPAPPYESLYKGSGEMLGEMSGKVLEYYKETGFQLSSECHDLPDHISVELEFLSRLSYKIVGDGKSLIRMTKFMENHILKWVPQFLNLVKKNTKEYYYKQLATFTDELIFKTVKLL